MAHYEAKMSSKGQVTVPAAVRDFLRLKSGDLLDFYVSEGTAAVRVRARNQPADSLVGMLNAYVDPASRLTEADIQRSIDEQMVEDEARITREAEEWREFQKWRRRTSPAAE